MANADGILVVWTDVLAEHEAEFNDWYLREHLHERFGVAGFLSARRLLAIEGAPKYLAIYETRSVDVLLSPEYLHLLQNPTPWSRKTMACFRNTSSSVCRQTVDAGSGSGGMVLTQFLRPEAGNVAALRSAAAAWAETALQNAGVTRFRFWEADQTASDQRSFERSLRPQGDSMADAVLVIEAETLESCRAALASCHGAPVAGPAGCYRLLSALQR